MNRIAASILVIALIAAALAAGYWWGRQQAGGPVVSATADKREDRRKILYYRNPMGLPDTSAVPRKDQMGMDYIPVYEGEEPEAGGTGLKISTDKVQKLGVRTEAAALRELTRTVRAVGAIEVDERRLYTVATKFEGWIERLHVNTTGQYVKRGEPLMEVYSPDLVIAQQEYIIAWKGVESVKDGSPEIQASMKQLVASAVQRLRNWDISEEELQRLQKEGTAHRTLTLRSPVSGAVLEKPALKGMRFMPGEVLYKIADLSSLWLLADIFEQDLALIRPGQAAKVRVNAYPDRVFEGKVAFVYPTVTAETRTAKARIEMPNPGQLLKPAMYASVELSTRQQRAPRLSVPNSAVLDSGTRQIVLVRRGEGLFEPREVKLGMRGDGYVEVIEGIKQGEDVVVSANFLIDAESNLRAALGTFGVPGAPSGAPVPPAGPGETHSGRAILREIDLMNNAVTLEHDPIASLKWPKMTMKFEVGDPALVKGLKPGANIDFEFVQQAPGRFVVTRIAPAGAKPAQRPASPVDHKGH